MGRPSASGDGYGAGLRDGIGGRARADRREGSGGYTRCSRRYCRRNRGVSVRVRISGWEEAEVGNIVRGGRVGKRGRGVFESEQGIRKVV